MTGSDIILGLLMEKSRTGYEINEIFETIFSHFYKGSYGMIYPTLNKLKKQGLVEKKVVVQDGKPNKNVFTITDKGKMQFYEYLSTDISLESRESEFLVRMYLGEYVEKRILLSWIKDEVQKKKDLIAQLKRDFKNWESNMTFSQKLSYEIGIKQYQVEVDLLNDKIVELKQIIDNS
ncbi:PadR family transcriptional regulator [Tissierella carlieri]|uniref:PadR family transcriptional regulator n=1 Tax=Tissierella carlieri TaxID=689904 RepID=A0ABT1SD41_9FIRM|nr:PadR family transcriptional regulator [Tissierella carlieri]MCQ4924393.1 PadR family transcriptional regulator [Tissierella carlieri]